MSNTITLDSNKAYTGILSLMHQCSTFLDEKYGYVLPGSPSLRDNIATHYITNPNHSYAKYGILLISALDELQKSVEIDKYE